MIDGGFDKFGVYIVEYLASNYIELRTWIGVIGLEVFGVEKYCINFNDYVDI